MRDHLNLRTEPATNDVADYGVKKAVENLSQLRHRLSAITDNYLDVQQDILETFLDRGQLRKLAQPTILAKGKRIPGLKLDHPRQLALMHALVRFAHIAAGNSSLPPIFTRVSRRWPRTGHLQLRRCATISPNSAPKASSQSATARRYQFSRQATRSAWSSSSFSNASTPHLLQGCCNRLPAIANCNASGALNSTAFISAWPTI